VGSGALNGLVVGLTAEEANRGVEEEKAWNETRTYQHQQLHFFEATTVSNRTTALIKGGEELLAVSATEVSRIAVRVTSTGSKEGETKVRDKILAFKILKKIFQI
jgi:hypothetical protein